MLCGLTLPEFRLDKVDPVKKSLWSLHLTMALLGLTALFSQLIPLSATDITFGRALVAFVVLTALVKLSGARLRLNRVEDYWIAIGLGILMAAHWVTYFAAMQYSTVSIGIIAFFTFPIISVLLEPFFEGIRLVWQDLVSCLVMLLGIYLMVPDISFENDVFIGIVLGVVSAFLYALRNLCHRKYFCQYGGAQAMAYQTLVIFVCLSVFISDEVTSAPMSTYWQLILLGIFFTALPHAMIAASLKHLRVKTFSLVACTQPLWGVLFAVLILSEKPSWQTLIGGALVISAGAYETLNAQKLHAKQ